MKATSRTNSSGLPLYGHDGPSAAQRWIEKHVVGHRIGQAAMFTNPHTGKRWTAGALRRWWKNASTAAGVEPGKFYEDTKHSFATDATRRGVPERLLQRYLGHASPASTRIYAQLADAALVDVPGPAAGSEPAKLEDVRSTHKPDSA